MEPKNVFISYSSKDEKVAFKICELLEKEEISCWIAPRDVTGGKSYGKEILEAISNAEVVLFIFSENSNRSRHVENEIDYAFNAEKIIIPFKIDDCKTSLELQYYLNKTHWISGSPDEENAIENLKNAILANISVDIDFTVKKADNKQDADFSDSERSGRYDMLCNKDGEIMIIIEYYESGPENPRIVYDGQDQALIYRSRASAFMLNNIEPEARVALSAVDEVLVIEIKDDDVYREYKVPVRHVKSLEALSKD